MDRNKIRIAAIDGIIDVALRKESVDRNNLPAARRIISQTVALRKESVDRNKILSICITLRCCRSPQGERG